MGSSNFKCPPETVLYLTSSDGNLHMDFHPAAMLLLYKLRQEKPHIFSVSGAIHHIKMQ
jgi:hypothetical protein